VNPFPADGREVRVVDFVMWLLEKIGGSVIGYGVYRVLDFFFKRR